MSQNDLAELAQKLRTQLQYEMEIGIPDIPMKRKNATLLPGHKHLLAMPFIVSPMYPVRTLLATPSARLSLIRHLLCINGLKELQVIPSHHREGRAIFPTGSPRRFLGSPKRAMAPRGFTALR